MENLPFNVNLLFIATVLITLSFLYLGTSRSKMVLLFSAAWLLIQAIIAKSGFYINPRIEPKHFLLLVLPPLFIVLILCLSPIARGFREICNPKWLTLLHSARLGVEGVLYLLFVYKQIPRLITFEGSNFDILTGLSAPLIVYFGYHKKILSTRILLIWNLTGIALLLNVVIRAVLSAPFSFQQFGFNQPNIAIFHFPFVWLPGFIVPAVLFCHILSIRKLVASPFGVEPNPIS